MAAPCSRAWDVLWCGLHYFFCFWSVRRQYSVRLIWAQINCLSYRIVVTDAWEVWNNDRLTTMHLTNNASLIDRWAGSDRDMYVDYSPGRREWLTGEPAQTGTGTLIVHLVDVNDNYPQFAADYRPVLYENLPPGRAVIEVSATDRDTLTNGQAWWPLVSNTRWPMVLRSNCSCHVLGHVHATLTRHATSSLSATFKVTRGNVCTDL